MYHNRAYRKLGRTHTHRLATLRALSTALFRRERITTTLMKAKELRPFAEKLITRARRDNLHARRLIGRHIQDQEVARKLVTTLSPRFADRPGGYMRIIKLGRRQGDGAEIAVVELIGSEPDFKKKAEDKKQAPQKKPGLASRLLGRKAKAQASGEPGAEGAEPSEGGPGPAEKHRHKHADRGGRSGGAPGARPKDKAPKGSKKT